MSAIANPVTMGGLGLLAQGPSLRPQNPWQGLAGGMMMGSQMQSQLFDQQMAQAELEDAQAQREAEAKALEAANRAKIGALMAQGMPQAQAEQIVAAGAAAPYLKPADPFENFKSVAGVGLVEQTPEGPRVVEGMEARPTTEINMGNVAEPVGENNYKWRMPDGSAPNPLMTIQDIVAAGGSRVPEGTLSAEKKRAEFEEGMRQGEQMLTDAQAAYNAAKERIRNGDYSAEARRELAQAGRRVGLARQSIWNNQRELSGRAQEEISEPGFLRLMQEEVEGFLQRALGGEGDEGGSGNVSRTEDGVLEIEITPEEREEYYKRYGVSP